MCGIAGIVFRSNTTPTNLRERLAAMAGVMQHRGPDDEGIYISPDGRVGLANRRLAIRDLSPAGHMPMTNSSQDVWITYNGEIYNAEEIRPELERLGYTFQSTGDTEVILHGYEAWGEGIIPRLRGMFALAIYDARTASEPGLLIARDHMGIKPVYYALTAEAFVFASEIKGLLASGLVSREVSASGLVGYLLTGSVPNPHTIYAGICALEPASLFQFNAARWGEPRIQSYWRLPEDVLNVENIESTAEHMHELLAEAVRIRLVSDVPLGAFLSGGLDSSTVVALMRRATAGPIRTCSMVFQEATYSEAAYASAMAKAIGAEHYERVISADDIVNEFDHILYAMDQPTIDGVNTYFVSQTARQAGLAVALSGLGGDELFGGYPNTFRDIPKVFSALKRTQRIPGGALVAGNVMNLLPSRQGWTRMQDALDRPASIASAYLTRRGLFSPREAQKFVHPDVWEAARADFDPVSHIASRAGNSTPENSFGWISRAEMRNYTHHQLLRDTDVMSMIHSLEVRVPLLDYHLVEAALRLPAWVKTSTDGTPKAFLTRAMKQELPAMITERRDKQGFTFPFDIWLRGGLKSKTQQVAASVKHATWINPTAVDSVLARYQEHQLHWSRVWALVALGSIT